MSTRRSGAGTVAARRSMRARVHAAVGLGAVVAASLSGGCGRTEALAAGPESPPSAPAPPAAVAVTPSAAAGGATPAAPARQYVKPSKQELKAKLTSEQYDVTQEEGTERPFHNEYWNNHEPGLYVDVTTGEPLFSSTDKFESGTGWPSFTKPVEQARVVEHTDRTLGMARTEVRSKAGDAHLGHVFDDGPAPTGMRYCINSAALRFIPVSRLAAEGYTEYLPLFAGAGAKR